jgi:hypothetical protein
MLMKGDMNKMLEEVNKVLEGAFNRIEQLEDKVQQLQDITAKKPVGRPKKVLEGLDKAA